VFLDAFGAVGSLVAPPFQGRSGTYAGSKPSSMDDMFTVCFV
jgi:hypothetical protein